MSDKPSAPLRARLRPDLVAVEVETPYGRRWHVKDPIALQFFQFDLREFALLQMLDGEATIDQLIARYHREFAPQHLTPRQLLFFIDQARKNGLLLLERPQTAVDERSEERTGLARGMRWLRYANVLAIRLPGIDPDRFLDAAYPFVRWLFQPGMILVGGLLIVAAALLVTLRFDEFLERLPEREVFFTPQTILWLAAGLAVAKVVHELAHAFACKHFGGECHELGVMLLVFVPCLYCNVSDSWLLARRRERMLITAAGMWAELLLAAGATFVWWFAIDGPVRMAALSIMLVGSVSTLLLNGNPLMRYDGYYLLSDLLQTPNLSSEASGVLADWWRRRALGLSDGLPPRTDQPRGLLAAYGIASFAYRLFIFTVILLAVHALAREFRLQVLAWFVTFLSLSSLVLPPLITASRPLLRRNDRRRIQPGHAVAVLVTIGAVIGGLLFVPVPHGLRAPFVMEADTAERIFVTVPGRLIEARHPGEVVTAGEVVGRLENPGLERERESLVARRDLLQEQLAAFRAVRGDDDETAARIPVTRKAIEDIDRRLATLDGQLQRLQLKATQGGQVLTPPNVPREPTATDELPLWHGSPLDTENLGCYLEAGTPLCLVGDPDEVTATVIVPQEDLRLVRPEQSVELLLQGLSDRTLRGVVREVSPVPVETLPRELAASGVVPVDPQAREEARPLEPVYRVRVQLESNHLGVPPLRWSTGDARIRLAAEPLAYRLWRSVQRTFHFEL